MTAPLAVVIALCAGRSVSTAADFQEMTELSTASVQRGTDWLLSTFNPDGGCGVDVDRPSDIGCTAITGLALLSQGSTPMRGPHAKSARQVLSFILRAVDTMPLDDITQLTQTQLQNKIGRHAHSFFAAAYLSQVLGEVDHPEKVHKALRKLIEVIQRAQQNDGSWGEGSWAPVLGTVMGWVSLRGGHFAGCRVLVSIERTERKLLGQMENEASGWMHTLYKNASGVRVLQALGKADEPTAAKAFKDILRTVTADRTPFTQAGGEEYLAFHLINECMLQSGGKKWEQWFPCVRGRLIEAQNQDGSWTGHHCITSRTFCTAASLLVLTSPNRYLPLSQK